MFTTLLMLLPTHETIIRITMVGGIKDGLFSVDAKTYPYSYRGRNVCKCVTDIFPVVVRQIDLIKVMTATDCVGKE